MNRKRILQLVVVAVVVVFLGSGYGAPTAKAFHSPNHGYFYGLSEGGGWWNVWPSWGGRSGCQGDGNALPTWVNTTGEFIDFVKCKLGGNTQERIGAAFMISTMIGAASTNPSASQVAEFEARINHAAAMGWINFGASLGCSTSSPPRNTFYQSNRQDVAWYYGCPVNNSGQVMTTYSAITISNGSTSYIIVRLCANPLGNMPVLQNNPNFNMSGTSAVSDTTVNRGQQITFSHTLFNSSGSTATNPTTINWTTQSATSSSGPWSNVASGNAGTFGSGQSKPNIGNQTITVPSSAAPGSQICRRISWNPDTHSGGSQASTPACATVQYNFNLVPRIHIPGSRTVQQGDQVTFEFYVRNTGTTVSMQTNCSLTGTQPSGTPAPPSTNCPRTFTNGVEVQVASPQVITITNQPAGSRICRTLTVTPSVPSGGTATSGEQCVIVAKTPYVHFMGSDVWAGGGFLQTNGTCTTNGNAKITTLSSSSSSAGSAVEYAAFALGEITRFGSANKPLHNSADFADLGRRLSFANNTTTIGQFGAPQHCMNDYATNYESATPVSGTVDLNRASGSWHSTGNLTLSGVLPAGSEQVYLVDGDVVINGNIGYISAPPTVPTYSSADQIPSLVIIARGDIRVAAGVTNLDGIFIARNTFYTCYPKPSPPTINTCNQQLTVNGSVIAGTLDLYRTFGGDGATVALRQRPAEIFKFSPELYLNNALNTAANSSVTTSDSRELPPRF